jgi:hypothetical protein
MSSLPEEEKEEEEEDDHEWPDNYFNYFTEIEDRFQTARGTGLFLLSPLDWALIENWKNAGVPLQAVLEGIDAAFEKWRTRKIRARAVNSLAYCAQAVAEAAQRAPEQRAGAAGAQSPFTEEELRTHLDRCALAIGAQPGQAFQDIEASLRNLAASLPDALSNVENLERRLSALEDKLVAAARSLQTDEQLYRMREALDRDLSPYRGKMTADQLALLERRYLDTAVLESAKLPRLSLFYLH